MVKQHTESPSLGTEIVRATPSTLLAGISAGITSWFGLQHYAPKIKWVRDNARGANGEKLIVDTPELLEHVRTLIHKWKAPNAANEEEFHYSVAEVLDAMEERTTEYGLTAETKQIQKIRAELPEKYHNTRGFDPLKDKTRTDKGEMEQVRKYIRGQLLDKGYKLFDHMSSALRTHVTNVDEAKNKIGGRVRKFSEFQHTHNEKVIKRFRDPLTTVITGTAIVGTLASHISGQREKQSMVDRIDNLESSALLGDIQR